MTTKTLTRKFLPHASTAAVATSRPAVRARRRAPLSDRLYDMAVAGLILLSASVALYRLIWMGQP